MRRLLPVLGLLVAGCGAEPPRWTPLFEGDFVRETARRASRPLRIGDREWTCRFEDGGAWLGTHLRRAEWKRKVRSGFWRVDLAARGFGEPPDGSPPARLEGDGVAYTIFAGESFRDIPEGTFAVGIDAVLLELPDGEEPPDDLRLSLYVGRGRLEGGRRRVVGERYTGDGLSLWPGERIETELEVDGPRTLRFATTLEPFRRPPVDDPGDPVTFRVELDGRQVLEHVARGGEDGSAWHAVPLPGAGRRTVRLALAIEGPFAFTNVLDPVVGPADVGSYGERPWDQERPNLVLFVADTFRADNMEAYGGEHDLTPRLDALADESLLFGRAWSTSTYTLPAHTSMFTGLYPRYAGIRNGLSELPESIPTIAARLHEAGYRTAGVTDRGYLSPIFGLDRGYAFFDVYHGTMEETRERVRAVLDADDGRPLFLFVHSFRVHAPYDVGEETRREHGEALGIEGTYEELSRRRRALPPGDVEAWAALAEEFRAHYLGGVADFDRELAVIVDDLEARGVFSNGVLTFTSDHGEAFNENGGFMHGGDVFEVEVRVPLFLHGAGIEPGRSERPASLVDLTPTLADLAGLAPDPGWHGRSLLVDGGDRALYLFRNSEQRDRSTLGIVEGDRKVLAHETLEAVREARTLAAFDLSVDPHETVNLVESDGDWPRELLRRHAARLEVLLVPREDARDVQLDAGDVADLSGLGYLGDDE